MRLLSRRSVAGLACVVALLAGCRAAPAETPEVPGELVDLVEALRGGGHVLFLRHAATDTSIPAGGDNPREDCDRQRNLTARGREDAAAFGEALRALDVPVGEVRASPFCRTLDTARLAFDDVQVDDRLQALPGAAERLRTLLLPPEAGNRVLVGHASTMATVFDLHLEEGEAAVLAPGVDGEPRVVGRLSAAALDVRSGGG